MTQHYVSAAFGVLLSGCMKSSAFISDLEEDKVIVQARYPNPTEVTAEANRGCAIHGRTAVSIDNRCLDRYCETQSLVFACKGNLSYSENRSSPWLGMSVDDVTDHLYANPPGSPEVVITRVFSDGPADKAGLKVGDMIESFNGVNVNNSMTLIELKGDVKIGAKVPLRVRRGNKDLRLIMAV